MNKSKVFILKSTGLVFVGSAAFVMLTRSGLGAETKSKPKAAPVLTVEKADKNIKVLTGMPESELIPTMKSITVSLGVSCDYCHVTKNGKLDTAADDKETKRIARAMMKMVIDDNKSTFHGEPQVSCYTCHRGKPVPESFTAFPVAVRRMPPPETGTTAPAPSATPALPSAEEILNKYSDAIGGQGALAKIKSAVIHGTVVNASGSTGTFETDQVTPDKGYDTMTTQRGARVQVLNDGEGWDKNAFGVQPLSGQQLQDLKLSLPLFGNLKLREQFVKFESSGREKIENRDVYVLKATRPDKKREALYFDSENGLLLRRVVYTDTAIGAIPEQTDFDNYSEVEGVKLPMTIRVSAMDTQNPTATRTIEKVELNVPVDSSRFDKPN